MVRKWLLWVVLGFALLQVEGIGCGDVSAAGQWSTLDGLRVSEGAPPPSENQKWKEEYRKLEDDLRRLLDELKRLEKSMEDKVRNEIIPFLRKEIENLRERIRRFRMDEKPPESEGPVRT